MAESIAAKTVMYALPAMDAVRVEHEGTMDIYSPPDATSDTPAVVIVAGYPDGGFERMAGCKFKDMGSSTSWARLIAASGLVAIAYTNENPESDLHALVRHLGTRRIGLWASSGNVPLALALAMTGRVRCAALLYGYTLQVEEQAKQFRFANPCAGKTVEDLREDVPLFLARAGRDEMPRINDAMDAFIAGTLRRNLPVTVVNHPTGPHAF